MTTMTLDKVKLKQVVNASKTATATMIVLGFRQRSQAFTTLAKVKSQLHKMGENVVDPDYWAFWRGMEESGAGSIILGRRGGKTRFEWAYSLKQVAKIAIEGTNHNLETLSKTKDTAKVIPQTNDSGTKKPTPPPVKQERLVFNIEVRPDFKLEVNLPSDISTKELEKIRSSLVLSI